jgi:hypothetical protein
MVTGMNRWYTQLFKQVKANPDLAKLKLSEETFSENYVPRRDWLKYRATPKTIQSSYTH